MTNLTSSSPAKENTHLRTLGIALLVGGAAFGIGRGLGYLATEERAETLQAEAAAAATECGTERTSLEARQAVALSEAEARSAAAIARADSALNSLEIYEAFRLSRTARADLDARNFGTAELHMRDVEQVLAGVASSNESLNPILTEVRDMHIVVAGDLAGQLERVRGIESTLDAAANASRAALNAGEIAPPADSAPTPAE